MCLCAKLRKITIHANIYLRFFTGVIKPMVKKCVISIRNE